ncbi:MAG: hypothetical protein LBD99_03205 [Candidatus Margulisbacteria bacterium]|jgi:hypothetical protein|nr:hypothetical protein [Candidatus Margulisiibacteriota bacterium]
MSVIPPVDFDDKVPQAQEAETAVARNAEKPARPSAPQPELPGVSFGTAYIETASTLVDRPEQLARHRLDNQKNARLKTRATDLDKIVFGRFVDPSSEEQTLQSARCFYALLADGYALEAALQFRQMSPELQENIGYQLLRESQFTLGPVRAELAAIFKNSGVSAELKALAAEKLAAPQGARFGAALNVIREKIGEAYKAAGAAKIFQEKPEFLRLEKIIYDTGDAELIRQYEEARRHLLDTPRNIRAAARSFRDGLLSQDELEAYLDNAVLGLQNIYAAFAALLDAYQNAEMTQLRDGLQRQLDAGNQCVADTMRDAYQQSGGRVVLKLSEEAYLLVNESLARLGAPPLSALHCVLEYDGPGGLDFLAENYEYAAQYMPQMSQAMDLVVRIFRADAAEMAAWREEKLAELRKLEEFLEKVKAALRDFYKKLADNKNLQKLENAQIVLNTYARGIQEIEAIINNKLSLNKTGALNSTLAKYRLLYESERWKVIVDALKGTGRSA